MIWTSILSGLRAYLPRLLHIITDFVVYNPFDVFSGARGNRKASTLSEDSPKRPYYEMSLVLRRRKPRRRRQSEIIDLIGSPPHKLPSPPPKPPLPLSHPARARAGWLQPLASRPIQTISEAAFRHITRVAHKKIRKNKTVNR